MLERELFLQNFRELFDETEPEQIQFETEFKNLEEWSSLIILSLIVQFEDSYSVKLLPNVIQESSTIEDLYKLIN